MRVRDKWILAITKGWETRGILNYLLWPFSWLFGLIIKLRLFLYQEKFLTKTKLPIPVIVVGNITVGGNGKTPVVIALAQWLTAIGYRPGIISRGYGGRHREPTRVSALTPARLVGDEARLIWQRTGCPVVVAKQRVAAAQVLAKECNLLISDDGLQHYALGRDIEICVVSPSYEFGNGFLLPAGPLREPVSRLNNTLIIRPQLHFSQCYQLKNPSLQQHLNELPTPFHAVAGIGQPEKFFQLLRQQAITFTAHPFPDHYAFKPKNLKMQGTILLTEKDAVKCTDFAHENMWVVQINAMLEPEFCGKIQKLLGALHEKSRSPK